MDSEGQDFYYDDDIDEVEEIMEDDGQEEEEEPDYAATVNRVTLKHYRILKEEEIRQLQDKDISEVSNVLSVSRSVACTILCQNNWTTTSVYDKWFSSTAPAAAPGDKNIDHPEKQISQQTCKICFETKNMMMMMKSAAECSHLFCTDCWNTYISISIKGGLACLTLPCPEPGCKSYPGLDMVDLLASPDDKDKYYRYLYRYYVESNTKRRKWCPAPGCDFAIEFMNNADADESKSDSYQVTCDCGYKLCWNCSEESHSPLDCQKVAKWMEKNSSEAENTTWILAYTKPCPKCRRAIEKNQGCNHMTCSEPCRFEFCWLCLENWTKHGYDNSCNKYNVNDDGDSTDERSRKKAEKHIQRYTHYYERWDSNDKSRKRAVADLNTARNEHVDRLSKTQQEPLAQLDFVIGAWEQIVECRRVLKWSYAYGYYLSESTESCSSSSGKLRLFEHLQGEAESGLERLHHCAEKEMYQYLSPDCPNSSKDFNHFRTKLAGLTSVTKNYFQNLVGALENNLSEVENVESSKARQEEALKNKNKNRRV